MRIDWAAPKRGRERAESVAKKRDSTIGERTKRAESGGRAPTADDKKDATIVSNSCVDTGVQIRNEFGGLCTRSVCDRGSLQRRQSSKTRRRRPTLRLDRLLYFCALSVVTWAGGRLLQFILDLSTPDLGSGGMSHVSADSVASYFYSMLYDVARTEHNVAS